MPNDANQAAAAQPNQGASEANSRPRSSLAMNPSMSMARPAKPAAKQAPEAPVDEGKGTVDASAPQDDESDIPEKFRGKSKSELVRIYKDLESDRGRMANELGQLRLTVSELLELGIKAEKPAKGSKASKQVEPEEDPVTNDRLLADPDKEIKKAAKKAVKDEIDQTQQRLTALEYEREVARFEKRFPEYQETMKDEGFIEWVKKTPSRQKLASGAVSGNFEAAHELFSLWEEVNEDKKVAKPKETPAKADKVDDAATARPGSKNAAAAKSAANTANKPTFKRSDIRKMFVHNRTEYNRRFAEIQEAYREGRVVG